MILTLASYNNHQNLQLPDISLIIQLNDVIKWFVYSGVNSLSDAQFDVVFNMNL